MISLILGSGELETCNKCKNNKGITVFIENSCKEPAKQISLTWAKSYAELDSIDAFNITFHDSFKQVKIFVFNENSMIDISMPNLPLWCYSNN